MRIQVNAVTDSDLENWLDNQTIATVEYDADRDDDVATCYTIEFGLGNNNVANSQMLAPVWANFVTALLATGLCY